MTEVIGKGVIEVSADSRKLTAGIDAAKRSLKDLGITAGDATKGQSASIDKYVKSLGLAAVTVGKTGRELELYKLGLRGASAEQLKAADSALKMSEAYERGRTIGTSIKTGLLTVATAAVAGTIAAVAAFDILIKKAAQFQDLSETTGASAEGLASIAVAAATAGVAMDSVAGASIKLTKNLTGVDDEGKAAGAALVALGLNIADFKKLDPVAQFDAIAKALSGFSDSATSGAAKTAVALALYGKAGAEQLKVFKAIEEQGGRQVILTEEQIRQADEYADTQAKSRAQLLLYASAIATQMLPAVTALTDTLGDAAKELLGVDAAAKKFGQGGEIKAFAQDGVLFLASLADVAFRVGQTFRYLGDNIGAAAAQAVAIAKLDFAGAAAIGRASIANNEQLNFSLGLADRLQAKFASINSDNSRIAAGAGAATDPRRLGSVGSIADQVADPANKLGKPKLNFSGAVKSASGGKGAGGKDTAVQEAKAQLAIDLSDIKGQADSLVNTFSNAEKVMEALRSASLLDEREYYASKLAFLNLNNTAQEEALKQEIARLGQEKLTGKDKLDNQRKIAEAQAKLAKVRENAATGVQLLSIQEEAAAKKLAQYYRDAEAAAQDYLDTLTKAQRRELSGFGVGTQERERTAGRAQIEDKYTGQRSDLERSKRDAELSGTFGGDAQKKYDAELDRIRRFQAAALGEYDAYYAQRLAKEKDWSLGASEALANYVSNASNIAKQSEKVWTDAFQGMEDALVDFTKTGKLDSKSLADSIISDLVRIAIRQQISNAIGVAGSSGGGGFVGILGSVIGAVSGTSGLATAASVLPGNSLDNFLNLTNNFAGRALGGPVSAGGIYRVNETRPELLNVAGKQYLMMGNQGGTVDANSSAGQAGNTVNMTVNQSFAAGTSRATTLQAAADARRQLEHAGRNL